VDAVAAGLRQQQQFGVEEPGAIGDVRNQIPDGAARQRLEAALGIGEPATEDRGD
jgi:hypothetical protein